MFTRLSGVGYIVGWTTPREQAWEDAVDASYCVTPPRPITMNRFTCVPEMVAISMRAAR
jgi:hypothetical protein